MNNKLNDLITSEGWESFDSDQREWLIFNFMQKIDKRLKALERRKKFDTGISFIGGLFGGFIAFFTSKIKFGG